MVATNFINNCLNQQVVGENKEYLFSLYELNTLNYFDATFATSLSIINKAYSLEEYGSDKSNDFWDAANDLMYLQVYLQIVQMSVMADINNGNCSVVTYEDITKRYKLDCIKKHFSCLSIDIDPLLAIFGLDKNSLDGINYMGIELGDCDKIFEIQ